MRKSSSSRRRLASQGFNLVILVMAVTVLNILLALALPAWSNMIEREKENELIFRGLQYAEAIRVFQIRNGRLPTTITELIEVVPRSIRQLWKNPIPEDGSWLLLPPQAQAGPRGRPIERANQNPQDRGQPNRPGQPARPPQAVRVIPPRPGEPVLTPGGAMPFIGVASPEGEEALKTFMGSNEIKEWRFTLDLVTAMQQSPDLNFARPVNSGLFWRPFPPGVTPPNQAQAGRQPGQFTPHPIPETQQRGRQPPNRRQRPN